MTICIEKKEYKSFLSSRGIDSFKIALILFLIKHSTTGNAKYIYLDRLHCLFDFLICDQEFSDFPKLTIPPWNIDKDLKNKIIILSKNNLIELSFDRNKARYSLTDKGNQKINEMEEIEELFVINSKIKKLAKSVTTTKFGKSKVIF